MVTSRKSFRRRKKRRRQKSKGKKRFHSVLEFAVSRELEEALNWGVGYIRTSNKGYFSVWCDRPNMMGFAIYVEGTGTWTLGFTDVNGSRTILRGHPMTLVHVALRYVAQGPDLCPELRELRGLGGEP